MRKHLVLSCLVPLLFAYWAARRQRWRIFWPMAMVAVACKEDFAFALAMLGVVVALRGRSRAALRSGAVISATFVAWYVVVSRVLIPWRNGGSGTFYEEEFFGDLGSSPLRVIWQGGQFSGAGLVVDAVWRTGCALSLHRCAIRLPA